MPYMVIEDFSLGWDLRKSAVTASAKSLRLLRNGYVNAGGEIEKRRGFPHILDPGNLAGTYGLGSLGTAPFVFGAGARPPGLNAFVGYVQLVGASIARITDVDVFDNQFYVVVQQPDGHYAHYYNGAHVTEAPDAAQAMAHRSKMYAIKDNIVYFSAVNDPMTWTPTTGGGTAVGAGFIQLDGQEEGTITLVGMAAYYDQLALFGRTSIQLWAMDVDPAQNQLVSTLGGTGLVAPKALSRYATGDVLYLNDSGVRSLKARDASNAAIVSDIGSPIDDVLRAFISAARATAPPGVIPAALIAATGLTEPTTGQFWLVLNNLVYVLSIATSSHISAWSRFELPFFADYIVEVLESVMMRSGDDLYVYGTGYWEAYDDAQIEVITPMIAGSEPATNKSFFGVDAALEGTWQIEVGTDPAQPDVRELVATVTGPTFGLQNLGLQNEGTHISARLTSSDVLRARIGNLMFHFNKGSTD